MNTGKKFGDFVTAIERNAQSREDVVARLNACELQSSEGSSVWTINGVGEYDATPTFHRSVAETLRIPVGYYGEMQAVYPALLDANVNAWTKAESNTETRLMRLFQPTPENGRGAARVVRSTSFLPLDNDELLQHLQPVLDEAGVTVQSCEIGERRTHLKITTPRLKGDVKVGDAVEAGISIVNSELGFGNMSVQPFIYRLVCTNGMATMQGDEAVKRIHRATAIPCYRNFTRFVDTDERKAAKAVIWQTISEAVGQSLREATFQDLLERLQAAQKMTVKSDSEKLIERVAKQYGLSAEEHSAALANFETDDERSVWGLANAITRIANTTENYERASALESIGGQIIQLPEKDWQRLAEMN